MSGEEVGFGTRELDIHVDWTFNESRYLEQYKVFLHGLHKRLSGRIKRLSMPQANRVCYEGTIQQGDFLRLCHFIQEMVRSGELLTVTGKDGQGRQHRYELVDGVIDARPQPEPPSSVVRRQR